MSNLAICALPGSSLQAARTIEHPPWCDPRLCEVTSNDVAHASHPVRWRTLDAEIELSLIRSDEFAFDRPGGTELAFSLRSTIQEGEANVYLTAAEAQALAYPLLTHAAMAETS